jgi:rhodanese-related sulfurtransferase
MMGVPLEGPANVFCDNNSVVINASTPESTLKKKHIAICYHMVREAAAANILCVAKILGTKNLSDVLTKNLPGPQLRELCGKFMYR